MSSPIAYAPLGRTKMHYPKLNVFYIVVIVFFLSLGLHFINSVQIRSDEYLEAARKKSFAGDDFLPQMIDLSYLTANMSGYNYANNPACDVFINVTSITRADAIRLEYKQCAEHILLRFWGDNEALVLNFPTTMYVCDQEPNIQPIPLQPFVDEEKMSTYWAALPNCKNDKNILVKVGETTNAEESLKQKIGNMTVHQTKHLENYTNFFNDLKGGKDELLLDMLWITKNSDMEYGTFFNEDQFFEKNNITVCQINLKLAKEENDLKRFSDFLNTASRATKFISMRAGLEKDDVTTTFFLNTRDQRCIDKYLM